ncbi:hypothetical protein LCGC14_0399190 [marine sediment metagenome]|uniref:Uncharacterized protein n=1 Tax=marine sediment metagenome TaxID=412755 RepID=A0A0F9W6D3_9ZZZZ|nr:hypothetical protein [Candidatus Aminicenantes bacterium]
MDTSKEYVKMCDKAEEIQNNKWLKLKCFYGGKYPWNEGDMFFSKDKVYVYNDCSLSEGFIDPQAYDRKGVWLPRQDQLQEMLPKRYATIHAKIGHFGKWLRDNDEYLENAFCGNESMEQLWLAFVMKEKYNKIWNGEGWIKE